MALPGQPGGKSKANSAEVERLHHLVVRLRLEGLPWSRISVISGYSVKTCQRIFREERDNTSSTRLIEVRRKQLLERYDHLHEWLRQWVYESHLVTGDLPAKDAVDLYLRGLNAEGKMLGLPLSEVDPVIAIATDTFDI